MVELFHILVKSDWTGHVVDDDDDVARLAPLKLKGRPKTMAYYIREPETPNTCLAVPAHVGIHDDFGMEL